MFTTEGHILTLGPEHLRPLSPVRRKLRRVENLQCPAYQPLRLGIINEEEFEAGLGLQTGILSRADYDYARALVGTASDEIEEEWWSPEGFCDVPVAEPYVSILLS